MAATREFEVGKWYDTRTGVRQFLIGKRPDGYLLAIDDRGDYLTYRADGVPHYDPTILGVSGFCLINPPRVFAAEVVAFAYERPDGTIRFAAHEARPEVALSGDRLVSKYRTFLAMTEGEGV